VPEHLAVALPAGAAAAAAAPGGSVALATVLERSRLLCLLQYEKELHSAASFMELVSKLGASLSDEQLSVFAGAHRSPCRGFHRAACGGGSLQARCWSNVSHMDNVCCGLARLF
jgi:hypothetical protein